MKKYKDYLYPLAPGVKALVVMAADAEYGDCLKNLAIKPLITGVGPINAASELTMALAELAHMKPPNIPDVIINLGSAGSQELDQGKVYRVSSSSYRDMDASAFGFSKGETPFSAHPAIVKLPAILPQIPSASCSTGANVADDHSVTGADMAEMEYAAYATVAMNFGLPLIGFKGISDGKIPLSGQMRDWTTLLPVIDQHLAEAVSTLQHDLKTGNLSIEHLRAMPEHWQPELAVMQSKRTRTM